MVDYKALGKRIKNARLEQNFTQEYLAKKIGLSTGFIADIERGRVAPSIETIVDIVNTLETSTDKVLFDSLNKIVLGKLVDSKIIYDKEIKELIDDLNHDELKTIIEIIKFNKDTMRKISETERKKHDKKKK